MQYVPTKLFDIIIIGHIHTIQQLSAQPSGAVLIVDQQTYPTSACPMSFDPSEG